MADKKELHLVFDNGSSIGSWSRVPDPDTEPRKFLDFANEIGFHIAYGILRDGKSCAFEWRAVPSWDK